MFCLPNLKKLSIFFLIFSLNSLFANSITITLATDPWAPYYGPKLKNNGYLAQLVKEAFIRKGYELKILFVPWKRAYEYSKVGDYDGLMGAFYKDERTEFFEYSNHIDQAEIVFFIKKDKNISYKNLKDLSKYKIGVVRGYHYSKEFDKEKENLHLFEANHSKDNIKLLIFDRVDLILGSKKVILSLIKKHYPQYLSQIKFLSPIVHSNKLYVCISKKRKNHKQIISDFNEGLKEIIKDKTYDKILKFHNF